MWRMCGCGRPCWWLLRLSARQAWGGFDVTEAVPVKHRFNTVMLWPGMQSLSPLILFQSLSQPLISDSAGPRSSLLLLTNLLSLAPSLSLLMSLYHPLHFSFLFCILHFSPFISPFLLPPNRNPMAIILMQHRINPKKRRRQK